MNIDLWIIAAAALFAGIGYYTGAIQQLSHWIGLAAAYFCAKPLADALSPAVAARMGWPQPPTAVGLSAALFPVVLLAAALASRALLNAVAPGHQRNTPDRVAGLVLGAGKAGALAWVALSIALAFETPLARARPDVEAALRGSSAAAFTRAHGLFAAGLPPELEKLRALAAGRTDPDLARTLRDDPALKALLADPALRRALEKGDPSALLANPQIRKLLADPELAKKLETLAPR